MNELIFEKIEICNFFSIGNIPLIIEFNRDINFVCGYNHTNQSNNGCGKTVIFYCALYYALFGEAGRDIKQTGIINYYNNSKMYVKLNLKKNNQNIEIYRSKKPNSFYYKIENEEVIQLSTMKETQIQLNKLLDISEDIFTNVFFINASNILDFIKEEGSTKLKERFERMFFKDIIFKKVLESARKKYNIIQKTIQTNQTKITEKVEFIKRLKNYIDESKKVKNYKNQLKELEDKNIEYETSLQSIREKIEKFKDSNKISELIDKEKKIINLKNDLESKIFHKSEKIKEINKNLKIISSSGNKCPICLQSLNEHTLKKIKEEYNVEEDNFKKEIDKCEVERKNCENKILKIKTAESKFSDFIGGLQSEEFQVSNKISEAKKQIEFFRENYDNELKLKNEFDSIRNDLLALKKENDGFSEEFSDLELIVSLFDNSGGGLIEYFIEKILKSLNKLIEKYIQKMQIKFSFWFDKNLKLKFNAYDTIELGNFSSGEIKVINFIVLFSLIEFFYNSFDLKPSILIMDEIMDTSIAEQKMDLIFQIINEFHKENNIGIYLLSHDFKGINNGIINFDNVIELESKEGFTIVKKIIKR